MSDKQADEPQEPTEPTEPQPQGGEEPDEPDPEPQGDDEPDWKAEARKWEKRAKQNSEAAERLKKIEDEKKTEQEKLQEQVEQLKPSAQEAARLRVALRKGLTEAQAKRLVGDTEDELETDADDLLASFQSPDEEREPSRRPRERLKPGATRDSEPQFDPKQVADSIFGEGGL